MTTQITLKEKSVYGNVLVYPSCEMAVKFALLVQKKTFGNYEIELIKSMGFEINLIKLSA